MALVRGRACTYRDSTRRALELIQDRSGGGEPGYTAPPARASHCGGRGARSFAVDVTARRGVARGDVQGLGIFL